MGIITKAIKSANEFPGLDNIGWHDTSSGITSTYDFYKANDYENAYPSITKIVNRFMKVAPYAIDSNKTEISNAQAMKKLYHPNRQMSSVDFREALAVMYLVHARTHILVWRLENGVAMPGGDITPDNIAGYTFLEHAVETTVGGKTTYTVNGATYTDREVITLKGMFPYDLSRGYSPTEAAQRWSRIDDYIADYQQGLFRNGAIPAGMFKIIAATTKEFLDIKDMMQARHRGAGKNNNVTYTHVPLDPETGAAASGQIEWVPFNVDNKSLDLKSIFEQVNQKLDSAFGVPASIRGVGENNNYATAQMDNRNFVENVVDPLLLKVWTRYTHELNRITGGLGYAITYDLDLPSVSEDEHVQAETSKVYSDAIIALVNAGFTVEAAVEASGAPDSFSELSGNYTPPEKSDDLDVDTGDEVEDSPDSNSLDLKAIKQIASRDMPTLYEDLVVDPAAVNDSNLRGCIMLKTVPLEVLSLVDDAASDLATEVNMDRSPVPGETSPHVTLLYGLLNNGNTWKDKVDEVLKGWKSDTVTINDIGFFELPDSYAIIAHIKATTELIEAHDRIGLLPNAETFSEYKPHMTLAYIKKDADLGKWIKALGAEYNGKELETNGLDYGDLPEKGAAKSADPKVKALSPEQEAITEQQLYVVAKRFLEAQVNTAIQDVKAIGDPTEEQLTQFVDDALNIISGLLISQGAIEQALGVQLLQNAGIDISSVTPFNLSTSQVERYRSYLKRVGESYSDDTRKAIRAVLDRANLEGYTTQQLQSALRDVVKLDDYRVVRLARTETVRAGGNASLYSMEQLQADTGAVVYKVWTTTNSNACPTCRSLDGTRRPLHEAFVPVGGQVEGTDGGVFVNNWVSAEIASIHPNDTCTITYEVERA